VLLRGHTELLVAVVIDQLHSDPVGDDAMLDGVVNVVDTPPPLRFVANVKTLQVLRYDKNDKKYGTFTRRKLFAS